MAYRNQNYMTNKLIKETVDKNQVGYVEPIEEEIVEPTPKKNIYDVILNEETYNNALANKDGALGKYYKNNPREDGVDSEGNPVRDPDTEVVGHSWASAITAPTDPAKTSTFPWIAVAFDTFDGVMKIKYDNEEKLSANILPRYSYWILSVPNDLNMLDYRLEWGTGNTGEKTFNPELLEVIFEEKQENES